MRNYNPTIVVLLDPCITGAGAREVCKKLKKLHWIRSEADGFSGVCGYFGMMILLRLSYDMFINLSFMFQSIHRAESVAFHCNLCKSNGSHQKGPQPTLDELQHPWMIMGTLTAFSKGMKEARRLEPQKVSLIGRCKMG